MVALRVVDAALPEEAGGILVGHKLGDGFLVESPGDADNGLDDELVHRACDDPSDEIAVDLEIVEGQRLEVVEGAKAGTEVVQGELAATDAQGAVLSRSAGRSRKNQTHDAGCARSSSSTFKPPS